MYVYCTSGNLSSSVPQIMYLGASVNEAEKAVKDFERYYREEKDFPRNFLDTYSAIPKSLINWEMIQWYAADGLWVSIVVFELKA